MTPYIERAAAATHDMLFPLLSSIFNEFKELSKKKQDGTLNAMKVKITNRLLVKVKAILASDPTIEFLDLLDEEALPTNSDVVLVIAQFVAAMEQFKRRHQIWYNGSRVWNCTPRKKSEEVEEEDESDGDEDDYDDEIDSDENDDADEK